MSEKMVQITMPESMAHVVYDAVELMMRLKLNQPEHIVWALVDLSDPKFCEKRDDSEQILKEAFRRIYPSSEMHSHKWKDDNWYRLYNVYQMLKYYYTGFDDSVYKPIQLSDIPLPEVRCIDK